MFVACGVAHLARTQTGTCNGVAVQESAYRASSRHVACDNCSATVVIFPLNLPKGWV